MPPQNKKAKDSNSARDNRKAWKKSHDAPIKAVSQATQARRDRNAAKRAEKPQQYPAGSQYTMPDFDWEWATKQFDSRNQGTRRAKVVALCLAESTGKPAPAPTMVEQAKTPHPRKPKGKVKK